MNPSAIQKACDLVKDFEGLRLDAYRDTGGVPTIGYGHTCGVQMGQTITQAEADAFLAQDMAAVIQALDLIAAKFGLGVNETAALISLAFNEGAYAVVKQNLSIYHALAKGTKDDVVTAMKLWNKDNGFVVEGLVNRRAEEAKIFLTPDEVSP